jgi:hypothetical protein
MASKSLSFVTIKKGIDPSIRTSSTYAKKEFEITAHKDLLPDQNFFFRAEKNAKGVELELDAHLRHRCP